MINGFEELTQPLTEQEKKLVPLIIKGFYNRWGKENSVTNKIICERLGVVGYKISDARIRKLINFIRVSGIIPDLIATSKGYYRTKDSQELHDYIESIRQRADAINAVAESMQKHLNTLQH